MTIIYRAAKQGSIILKFKKRTVSFS